MDMAAILKVFDNTVKTPVTGTIDMKRYISIISESPVDPVNQSENPIDTVTVDVPLLIRLLEYAKEDAKTDMDLHHVAEKLIKLGKDSNILTMNDYDAIVQKPVMSQNITSESIINYINNLKS